ncbi:MAG: ABC transporter substrate-binding protein [bacterium]|nr:ABC transporter substrate-binding protein [bacterium]
MVEKIRTQAGWLLWGILICCLWPPSSAPAAGVFVLKSNDIPAYEEVLRGFREVVGNSNFETFSLKGNPASAAQAVPAAQASNPAVILAVGSDSARVAREQLAGIPTVFSMVLDPSEFQKNEKITGVSFQVPARAQFQTLTSVLPQARRIGVIYDPTLSLFIIRDGRQAAAALNLILVEKPITSSNEIANAIKEMIWTVDVLWMIPDQTVVSKESFRYMLESTLNRKIPILTFSQSFVKGGALLALAPNYQDMGRQAGRLVQKILSGTSPGSLPSAHPQGYLFLNLNTANALNISVPPEILQKAEQIK